MNKDRKMPEHSPATPGPPAAETLHGISIHFLWGALDQQRKNELVDFWLQHRAIADVREAKRRTQEVVCLAIDAEDRIAGVSTVYIVPFGPEKTPHWHYRTFVRPDCRLPGIAVRILRASLRCLAQIAASRRGLSAGLVILTENRRLKHPGWHKILIAEGMHYLGVTPDGMDVWKHDFQFRH
jgi:GNAT superfamily N-acetyltransferase